MTHAANFLALDLGAESGRVVIGRFDGQRLTLEEVHRFANGPVRVHDTLHWDVLRLFTEIKNGLTQVVHDRGSELVSLGLDTWGVDFALLDEQGMLVGNPYHYRDSRTDGMLEEAFRRVPGDEIFQQTGIQFMQINTLFQLLAMVVQESPQLSIADTLLMMPDLFNYWLTGQKVSEWTIASTSQCLNPNTGDWAASLVEKLGIPSHIFPGIVEPGTLLGKLLPALANETGAGGVSVVAPGCHDTASAIAAVPAESDNYAYLSSGTWSLMGAEITEPIINATSRDHNFTNEGGVCDTIRLLKNITGMWLIQESRRTWAGEGEPLSYDEITQLAEAAPPFVAIIDPDAAEFLAPGDMPARIRQHCARSGQEVPESKGSIARTALESLALKYRWVLERLEELLGQRLETLHIVGGGSQNRLLNQFTADAIGRPVVTGPVEATAAGNVLMQMLALGHIASLEEGRDLIRRSFETGTYLPREIGAWDEAYSRFLRLLEPNGSVKRKT
ncbi:MAG: rhamnulokinase family protein [Anaerolineae bacterium]